MLLRLNQRNKSGGVSADILHHLHEEADTLLIMHCWEIARKNPFNQCIVYIVYSPDTLISERIVTSNW